MKIKRLRWLILSMVALATVINYIDRNAIGVMWPEISKDLGLDKDDYATIIFSFTLAYAIGQSAFGKIFDAIGTRLGFVLSIVIWSASIALHAVAKGVVSFSIVRFTMGFGEAGNWPGATKANAEWFPASERAFAQGIFNSGAAVGAIVSIPLTAFLFSLFGWKATFIFIAALGFVWVIPWMILYKGAPSSHPWLTDEEREYILSGQRKSDTAELDDGFSPGWFEMLRYKKSWSVILSRFFLDPVWWLFIGWLPIYLTERFGFNVKEIGLYGWVPYVGALLGALFGGWLSGRCIKSGWSINASRKLVITLGGVIMFPALILTAFASSALVAVLLMAVILFGFQTAIGNIQTLPSDFYGGKSVASLAGVSGTAAVLSVLATTKLVPVITATSYIPFFLLGAALVPLALLSIWLLAGEIEPVTPKDDSHIKSKEATT